MVLFNHATREMTAKIVYYGPGLCGKTTNLMVIFDKLDPKSKGKMLSLATKTDRTLFFDLLPVDIGKVGPFNLKIQLYTVPGQVFYNETRKLVLKGADAVVFVADSQAAMVEATRESFANLLENLEENQLDPNDTPIVVQFNKRDLPGILPVEELQEALGLEGYPYAEASAVRGDGVMETFKLISKITAKHLFTRLKGGKTEPLKRAREREVVPAPISSEEPSSSAEEPVVSTFGDSTPFTPAEESDYEGAEEVSLEQLLAEGRTRPETIGGSVRVPDIDAFDDIEELAADELIEEPALASAVEADLAPEIPIVFDDSRINELEAQIASLTRKLEIKQSALQTLLQELDQLRARVDAEIQL
ncbi:MAG TPA: GTPase domain-containing protein [Thermoanaerobaculia bacterium]